MKRQYLGLAGAAAGLIIVTSGITYAVAGAVAGSAPSGGVYATACTTSNHQLKLVNSTGRCPRGSSPYRLAGAPTPLTLNWQGGSTKTKTVRVGGITATAECSSQNAEISMTSNAPYVVQGTYFYIPSSGGSVFIYGISEGTEITTAGSGQISYATGKAPQYKSALDVTANGGATGNVLIVRSGHTIDVPFALFSFGGSCSVQAQLTPSG